MGDHPEQGRDSAANIQARDDSAGIDFLDFLFTFVLTFGLVPEALGIEGNGGPLSEGWFTPGYHWSIADVERVSALFLGLLTLTLSWFGYHASIRRQPLNLEKLSGLARFQIDVFLVLLYGLMLINYRSFDLIALSTLVVFGLFIIWDVLKAKETGSPYFRWADSSGTSGPNYRRELVTVVWGIAIAIDALLYFFVFHSVLLWSILAIVISVLYRVHKIRPWKNFEQALGVRA